MCICFVSVQNDSDVPWILDAIVIITDFFFDSNLKLHVPHPVRWESPSPGSFQDFSTLRSCTWLVILCCLKLRSPMELFGLWNPNNPWDTPVTKGVYICIYIYTVYPMGQKMPTDRQCLKMVTFVWVSSAYLLFLKRLIFRDHSPLPSSEIDNNTKLAIFQDRNSWKNWDLLSHLESAPQVLAVGCLSWYHFLQRWDVSATAIQRRIEKLHYPTG